MNLAMLIARTKAFTLAELLIALAILGIIATFTIPKVLQSQRDEKLNSIAKEAAGTVSQAYSILQMNNKRSTTTTFTDMTPYLNYVKLDTTTTINDAGSTGSSKSCGSGSAHCYLLHNGGMLWSYDDYFAGTGSTAAIRFFVDADGTFQSTDMSIYFFLYYNGRVATLKTITPNTCTDSACWNPSVAGDPAYFQW
jgi:prepilin-type N-terminal cleavage/methylation domain-containing protein